MTRKADPADQLGALVRNNLKRLGAHAARRPNIGFTDFECALLLQCRQRETSPVIHNQIVNELCLIACLLAVFLHLLAANA